MQWNQKPCAYLQQNLRSVQNQEQTLELRLPEGMPDIGNVLCAWGQAVLRSKQWRSDSIQLSGGVSAWVLYTPEDGSSPRTVECWLPFQAKWSLPETRREGVIRANAALRGVDARLLSARKLMVRASVGLLAEALEPAQAEFYEAASLPEDVQLLEKSWPVALPVEAGEKLFLLDEEAALPEPMEKLLAWELTPVIEEQTVLGSRVVFKGKGKLYLVYRTEDGKIHSTCLELPIAQFAELDGEYDKEAMVSAMPALSNLEPELNGEKLRVKAGIVCQYVVYDCRMLKTCEDAYSPLRQVEPEIVEQTLPVLLDRVRGEPEARQSLDSPLQQMVDLRFYPEQPVQFREDGDTVVELPGIFQLLGYNSAGQLQCLTEAATARLQIPAGEACQLHAESCHVVSTQQSGNQLTAQLQIELLASSEQTIPMVAGVELGAEAQEDPQKPTLILRRCNDLSLWELAKGCGSTVEAIRRANHLTADPGPGQLLLIPVC